VTGGGARGARAGHRSLFNTFLPTFGLDGAEPAQLVSRSGGKLEGESGAGLSTSTGTALNCSTGILILMLHLVQTIWWHTWHLVPRVNKPKRVVRQRKQSLPPSTASFTPVSRGRASNSALVSTDRM